MKIEKEGLIVRVLIALLFVFAGAQKIMSFAQTSAFIDSLGVPAASIATALVIFIELGAGLAFAVGYKIKESSMLLIGFTVLATILVHRDMSNPNNLIMVLKNLAIVGALLPYSNCFCICKDCKGEAHCMVCKAAK